MLIPVLGLTIGIALRMRVAAGWCIFKFAKFCWVCWKGMYGLDWELREKFADTCCDGSCVGDEFGELLARDERSEDEECIETNCEVYQYLILKSSSMHQVDMMMTMGLLRLTSFSVKRAGQNSMSSSRSKDLPASNFCRKVVTVAVSVSSFMLLTPLNCL